ncbi:MAG: ABC transporter substrate-binding protein [Thermosynechococcaceae cyanobacterium MS004]|nr:ABC transporter substrate-binding protein [Thermosynechococcaceae cyanobacterium MS004]
MSLWSNANDPETLIYRSNAAIGSKQSKTIAVSVPISSNLNVAQEILRGVAQVQWEINDSGGINKIPLKVKVIDDQNDPAIAQQVATALVKKSHVSAVIGHNSSDASLAAGAIYQKGKLVMVSPTSMATELSGLGSYLFRTVPNTRFLADPLAKYVTKTARKTQIAVCFDAQAKDNVSFKNEFIASFWSHGGRVVDVACDFNAPTFDPEVAVTQAIAQGADSILLAPHIDRLERAMMVARATKGRLAIFGSTTLYTFKTLQSGAQDINGLVVPAPWHPSISAANPRLSRARQLWKGEISWRTAMAIDATQAVADALARSSDRQGLQQTLRDNAYEAKGIAEPIQFLPTGDRPSTPILIKVQPDSSTRVGYAFSPLDS